MEEEYSVIRIKAQTKYLIDKHKEKTGKVIWFIVDEAIKEYLDKDRKEK